MAEWAKRQKPDNTYYRLGLNECLDREVREVEAAIRDLIRRTKNLPKVALGRDSEDSYARRQYAEKKEVEMRVCRLLALFRRYLWPIEEELKRCREWKDSACSKVYRQEEKVKEVIDQAERALAFAQTKRNPFKRFRR